MTVLPRPVTFLCAVLAIAGVVFAALTEGLIISAVRTAVAFMSILLGVVFLVSVAPALDGRRMPAPIPGPAPDAVPVPAAGGSMIALLEQLYPAPAVDTPAATSTAAEAEPRRLQLVDIDTGELVDERVARLEERVAEITREVVDLGTVVQDQAELTARAFGTLRREVERIGHLFGPEDAPDAV